MSLLSPNLVAFLAIVKHKTVHAAAASLHLTQTAVTQRIRVLERELHATLFIRSRKGMTLTTEGEALLHYCQAIESLEGNVLAKMKGAGLGVPMNVTISGPSSIMRSRVIPACLAVYQTFPRLLYHFNINDIEERHKTLQRGACDFAILQPEDVTKEMCCKLLQPEKYVLVAPVAWKDRQLKSILTEEKMIDFNPEDRMTINYLKQFDLYHDVSSERHFTGSTESIAYLISHGLGYGVLTSEFSDHYLKAKKLIVLNQGRVYENPMALAWFDRPEPAAYFSAIVAQIR